MIAHRIRLTPTLRAKLLSQNLSSRGGSTEFDEALFLINLRLRELALLLPLKKLAIGVIQKRIAQRGTSARLEREIAEQQEQIKDLGQLAEDWFKVAETITQQPSELEQLSEPIKTVLQTLGIEFRSSIKALEK